jgi:hypothetical protein
MDSHFWTDDPAGQGDTICLVQVRGFMEAVIVRDGDIAPSLLLGAMPYFLQVGIVKSNGDKLMQLTSWAPFVSENQLRVQAKQDKEGRCLEQASGGRTGIVCVWDGPVRCGGRH